MLAASHPLPVVEIFGPTIQGEGPDAGRPAHFVRFGGCDYRCSWCDTRYAVDPAAVRADAERLTADEVRERVTDRRAGPALVVLTGGNPALHDLSDLVDGLHGDGLDVAVETQGSVYRPWLGRVDRLVVSPKPPSSGEATRRRERQFAAFMSAALAASAPVVLKIVVFDERDLRYARAIARTWPSVPLHLSVGTEPADAEDASMDRDRILTRFRWLCEATANEPEVAHARVLPQLHVLAWGRARGV